jgi:hypothetical protein
MAQTALAEQALGRWVEAERDLLESLRTADDPWISKNRSTLQDSLRTIQEHLASVMVDGSPHGAHVSINGLPAGGLPLLRPVRVTAGSTVIIVQAPRHIGVTRVVTTVAGELEREEVALVPQPAPSVTELSAPFPRTDTGSTSAWTSAKWTLGAGGVLALGAATAFHLKARSEYVAFNTFTNAHSDDGLCYRSESAATPECQQHLSAGDRALRFAIISDIVTGVLFASLVGLVLWTRRPPQGSTTACNATVGELRCTF